MKGMKKVVWLGLVGLGVWVCFPLSSALGIDPSLLDGQWFKAKGSMKGYAIDPIHNVVAGTVSGGATFYMKTTYSGDDGGSFRVTTCSQDDENPSVWHLRASDPIPMGQIHGANLEIWDFDGTPVPLYDGFNRFLVYPALYVRITTDGPHLKKATLKTITCAIWGEMEDGIIIGSCKLSGSSITPDKVPSGCTGK